MLTIQTSRDGQSKSEAHRDSSLQGIVIGTARERIAFTFHSLVILVSHLSTRRISVLKKPMQEMRSSESAGPQDISRL